jgi:hypothetical protein
LLGDPSWQCILLNNAIIITAMHMACQGVFQQNRPGVADDHRQLNALEIQRVFHDGALEGFNFGLVPCPDGPDSAERTVAVRQLGPPLATIRS